MWNEEFEFKLPFKLNDTSVNKSILIIINDYDRGFVNDDLIGFATFDIGALQENEYENFLVFFEFSKKF